MLHLRLHGCMQNMSNLSAARGIQSENTHTQTHLINTQPHTSRLLLACFDGALPLVTASFAAACKKEWCKGHNYSATPQQCSTQRDCNSRSRLRVGNCPVVSSASECWMAVKQLLHLFKVQSHEMCPSMHGNHGVLSRGQENFAERTKKACRVSCWLQE